MLPTNVCSIVHKKQSQVADSADATLVQPSDWNDTHTLSGWGVVGGNATITVGATGCDFTKVSAALAYLSTLCIKDGVTVTVEIQDQSVSEIATISVASPYMGNVLLKGKSTYAKTLTSIQSSSGSAGAWSIVLNLTAVTDISVGDYVCVPTSVTGGSIPELLMGVHVVTNVDSANNRITITSKSRYNGVPAGAVAGTITVLKSKVDFSTANVGGFLVTSGLQMQDLVIVGGSGGTGISIQKGVLKNPAGVLALSGFSTGLSATQGGAYNSTVSYVCGGTGNGISAGAAGDVYARNSVISGFSASGAIIRGGAATADFSNSVSTGNTLFGYYDAQGGVSVCSSSKAVGNGNVGYYAESCGVIVSTSSYATANGGGGYSPGQNSQGNSFASMVV